MTIINITAEIDTNDVLGEVAIEDLQEELANRGEFDGLDSDVDLMFFNEAYELLAVKRDVDALARLREVCQEITGRVLP